MPVVRKHAAELTDSKEVVGRSVLLSNNKLISLGASSIPSCVICARESAHPRRANPAPKAEAGAYAT